MSAISGEGSIPPTREQINAMVENNQLGAALGIAEEFPQKKYSYYLWIVTKLAELSRVDAAYEIATRIPQQESAGIQALSATRLGYERLGNLVRVKEIFDRIFRQTIRTKPLEIR